MRQAIPESRTGWKWWAWSAMRRDDGLGKPVKPAIYIPYTSVMPPWTQILVRTDVPPLTILHGVREQIHPSTPTSRPRDMSAVWKTGSPPSRSGRRSI